MTPFLLLRYYRLARLARIEQYIAKGIKGVVFVCLVRFFLDVNKFSLFLS